MRIAIVSDIHGNLPALEAVIANINAAKPDLVINLGDLVSGPLWPKETLQLLQSLNWPTIRGNCDRAVGAHPAEKLGASDRFAYDRLSVDERQWLRDLPLTHQVSKRVFACHGTPDDDDTYLLERVEGQYLVTAPREIILQKLGKITTPLVLCGHSHIPQFIQVADGRFVLNVGSVGLPAHDARNVAEHVYFSESGTPHAKYALVTVRDSGGFNVQQRCVDYDFNAAVAKAAEAGRADWVQGLKTGAMT
ncbi:metallophosphoesterase family protein [Aestuariivirga litoralis]|uniref:metallophosphoesterase family protein n=1 Tax=Aestuariivirga litoralis TaxID=2650924 RepID=UPI0018C5C569|nr:metallophosphoesterase family protein [Aestuariivirga litoralis]MBG1232799.1 metallophosphoesterase family protein [Aestuariivirga litoralis]